ncbi:MAG: VWA domain-containing protein [Chloroflexota bacterium]|nr:VWA domain-containing protein [Chloroflexota bacterium]
MTDWKERDTKLTSGPIPEIEAELANLPPAVLEAYHEANDSVKESFGEEEIGLWAKEGLTIGTQTVRSWESAIEYYRVSPEVSKFLSFPSFMQWARCGTYLAQDSPTLAVSFFNSSVSIVPNLRPQYIPRWAGLGRSLYKGTWKSSTLAAKFFEVSPDLVRNLPFWDVEVFASLIEALSYKSYDVAGECLVLGRDVLPAMGREREPFLAMSRALIDTSWREVKTCLELVPRALQQVDEAQTGRFLKLGERLAKVGLRNTSKFLSDGTQALSKVPQGSQGYILDLCDALVVITPDAVPPFLKSLDDVLNRITVSQLDTWFQHGAHLLQENPESGIAFFKIESNTSESMLETLSSSLELDRVKSILRLYCRALAGTGLEIFDSQELVSRNIGWVDEGTASTDGTKIFLPPVVDHYTNKQDNFSWFKVVSTHQVAHLEFGSFEYEFEKPTSQFEDLRHEMEQKAIQRKEDQRALAKEDYEMAARLLTSGAEGDVEMTPMFDDPNDMGSMRTFTDIGRFLELFENGRLGFDIFAVLEDCRLDYRIKVEYPGIRAVSSRVQGETLANRPRIEDMPLQQGLVELLVHMSLDQFQDLPVAIEYKEAGEMLSSILHQLRTAEANVEDTAEATLRAYEIISRVPNEQEEEDQFEEQDLEEPGDFSEEDYQSLVDQLQAGMDASSDGGDGESYESPDPVDYRGDFKPEMVQLMTKLQADSGEQGEAQPMTQEMLEQLLQESPELEMDAEQGEVDSNMSMFAQNIMKEAGAPPPNSQPGEGYGPLLHDDDSGGELEAREPETYVYDEWDFRANDYKPRWCIVKEKLVEEGDVTFYQESLKTYSALSNHIRRQFELIMPESMRKTYRLVDGEDIDLNAALEAWADLRMGVPPDEKIYWHRNRNRREVAVVFLLDMSASTAEAIDEGRQTVDDRDAPDDPVEYMVWLRRRREGLVRRNYKRIIDLEKEGTTLLINALESIGDTYGIYGFSGYGRENVEFYVIKDINEEFSDKVKRRIDKVTPLHATRMGAAIRHAITKLDNQDAKTKIMFLISDGRPQDRGYSREGVEKEYAVHDTHMALVEAKHKDIIPFCLTVDKAGHDYLKSMCGDMGYEVLADIWSLPERLPMLYRQLTAVR